MSRKPLVSHFSREVQRNEGIEIAGLSWFMNPVRNR